ncbi:MAG TPA: cupredoxin domain-containing protein [Polyangiaceae bacterium]|nr:cupredoxin domain-containing protein [Polyangiaceae bacterium]
MSRSLSRCVVFAGLVSAASLIACKRADDSKAVGSSEAPSAAGNDVRVAVTDKGFEPSTVPIGTGRRLVFRRTSENTCATAVVFPDLKIEKELPRNQDVAVDLPASAKGEIGFQCGMGMYKSKVVAQ